ncbi:HNH endonuclease [Mesorhizobium sp.]|uniref:HNH endonuclease n=1 Tax=Mesorhizobium sp. TaxID=1871066 RepID=UPI001215743C|nr:HNH endonuclease [Mesorhizobium sp.]TIN10363.1 MAG: HNH endonuclease [Mesorhizobium sp.]
MGKAGPRPELRAVLRKKQGGRCCYCQIKMRISFSNCKRHDAETLEHLDRRTDGGSNARDNIALACYRCNSGRGDVDWLTYTTIKRGEHYERW